MNSTGWRRRVYSMMRSAIIAPIVRSVAFQIPARTVPIASYSTCM